MSGILAIWNDCRPDQMSEYEAWYQEEHLPGRVELEGFVIGRRYEAIEARRQFFTSYEVEHPRVLLESVGYLNLFHTPDQRTVAMMRRGFLNSCRTVCRRVDFQGSARGTVVLTLTWPSSNAPGTELMQIARQQTTSPELVHCETWISAEEGKIYPPSQEEMLRGGDTKISACILLEFLRVHPALAVANSLRRRYPNAEIGIYRMLCSILRNDLLRSGALPE